nr:MAG TPA: hypothetical protein [Caudoviricetes sp.]
MRIFIHFFCPPFKILYPHYTSFSFSQSALLKMHFLLYNILPNSC